MEEENKIICVQISPKAEDLESTYLLIEEIMKVMSRQEYTYSSPKTFKPKSSERKYCLMFSGGYASTLDLIDHFHLNHCVIVAMPFGNIGKNGFLAMNDLKNIVRNGGAVFPSGYNHFNLLLQNPLVDGLQIESDLMDELELPYTLLKTELIQECYGFVYPFGSTSERISRKAASTGYDWSIVLTASGESHDNSEFNIPALSFNFDDSAQFVGSRIANSEDHSEKNAGPKVSVIIPTFNRLPLLTLVLESLLQQDYPPEKYEIIVVDDGGSDGTAQYVQALAKKSRVPLSYLYQEDQGFRAGTARNLGAEHASGEFLLFLDGDVVAHPRLIAEHVRKYLLHSDSLVIGYVAAHTDKRTYSIEEVKRSVFEKSLSGLKVIPEIRDSMYCKCQGDLRLLPNYWLALFSNNFSIAKSIFDRVGGFDDSFCGWGVEDNELGYRLQQKGTPFVLNRQALGFHIGTEGEFRNPFLSASDRGYAYLSNNLMKFLKKHPESQVEEFVDLMMERIPPAKRKKSLTL